MQTAPSKEHYIWDIELTVPYSGRIPCCTRFHPRTKPKPSKRPDGKVYVSKVSTEEMERLWNHQGK